MIKSGIRVIRGPDWDPSIHEDGGPGHLGTIIDVSRQDQTCTVQWDNGHLSNCKATSDQQDLRIVYTESTVTKGNSHFAYCNICNNSRQNVSGLRFKCVTCKDYDLCMKCYMADEHDKTHSFVRINSRISKVIPILTRVKSKRTKLYGFGPGASVMLTPFATSSHIDDIGRIEEMIEEDGGTAKVTWPSREVTTVKTGKDGLIEIKLVEPHHVGHVYIDHIPAVDLSQPPDSCINPGDKVCVDLNFDTFQGLQQDYGGWIDDMEEIMGETGKVVDVPRNTLCEVYFASVSRTYVLFIAALTKMSVPVVGDRVMVLADVGILIRRQRYLWKEAMRNLIGKTGTVDSIDVMGNLSISFSGNRKFDFSPSCVVKDDGDSVVPRDDSDDEGTIKITLEDEPSVYHESELKEMPTPFGVDEESVDSSDGSDNDEDGISSDEEHVPKVNTSMVIAPGLRVVRGRDWKWSDQDGGEGHLGTIQEISGMRKTSCPDKCAAVLWDNGYRNTYRIGFENSYDLRIYDNAGVAGNRHQGMKCTEVTCEEEEDDIMGYVWQCISNPEVTLCNNCYHADKGDVTEGFRRIEYPGHKGVKVPKRQMTQRQKLLGIDVGARVIRGANWRWANQDGGPGQQGEVIALVNFSLDTDRDAAEITWGNEHSNVYRLGYEGMVDLKCMKPGTAKYYYPYHLPELKMPAEPFHIPETEEEDIPEADGRLRPGDKVMIGVDPDVFQSIHKEMKLWKEKMMEMIGMTGRVEGVEGVTVAVNFDGDRYKLHEMALNKVEVFSAGEFVKIMEDYGKVQKLQNGHGDWNDLTRKSLGKKGQVKSVNVDGDVKVKFGEVSLTFNPECLTKTEGPADFMTSSRPEPRPEPKPEPRQEPKPEPPPDNRNPSTDFKAAVEQDMEDDVLIHLNQEPTMEKKRELVSGQANFHPIYTACKNGSAGVLKALLKYAGSQALEEGDDGTKSTPLQIAVKKKHSDCVELLLSYNVNKDAVNDHRQSAVHLAVQNRDVATLRVLRKHKCDINKKDALGDSPVVDAIVRQQGDSTEMLDVILDWPGIDLNFENKNGFSPIHIAARKGDLGAVKNLLKKDRKLLNKEKSDGYTPLHLASCMDHHQVVQYLLDQPGINIDARTRDKGQTALLIACFYGSRKTADILLSEKYNCQIDIRDSDGNNALHLCLSGPPQVMEITEIQRSNLRENDKQIKQQLDLAELLVNKGVSYTVKNNNGKLPQELPSAEKLKEEFTAIIVLRSSREQHQLCPLCEEEGNEVYAVFVVQPCGCSLCNGCFNPKFKRCPNCGKSIQSSTKLKRK
ncbi:E3 ubiquitin-protein ligase MIB2-like [Mytilus californianus]|uniref:E3 ubiquitin-protein ligase MIB2-like n=1 Tax=Mytilus californianus TaxID=6549 RepID=UPI0022458879|nr:E3 ubiquitin-protein ligase MIB2-like [Mytilus californianus]